MDTWLQDLRFAVRTLLKSPGFAAVAILSLALGIGANTAIFSVNYFDVLGLRPAEGRAFSAEEDQTPLTHPVVIIGHGLWQRRFGGDPAIVGRTLTLNGRAFTVIGITPARFTGTEVGETVDL